MKILISYTMILVFVSRFCSRDKLHCAITKYFILVIHGKPRFLFTYKSKQMKENVFICILVQYKNILFIPSLFHSKIRISFLLFVIPIFISEWLFGFYADINTKKIWKVASPCCILWWYRFIVGTFG